MALRSIFGFLLIGILLCPSASSAVDQFPEFERLTNCPKLLSQLREIHSKIQITERSVRHDSENFHNVNRLWKIKGAPRFHGRIIFDTDNYDTLRILYYEGIRSTPGAGTYLLALLRLRFPDATITADLGLTNLDRAEKAFLKNPNNPDLSSVPFLSVMRGNFRLDPVFARENGKLKITRIDVSWFPLRQNSLGMRWVNRSKVLNSANFLEWVKQEQRKSQR